MLKIRTNNTISILCILWTFLVCYLWIVPKEYNDFSVIVCFCVTVVAFSLYLYQNKGRNYLSFEVLFLVSQVILFYVFPVFVYNPDTVFLFSFGLPYDDNYISKGVCIASIGLVSFMIGNILSLSDDHTSNHKILKKRNNLLLSCFCTLLYIAYYLIGGFQHFIDVYKNGIRESTSSSYVLVLIQSAFPLLLLNELWNKKVDSTYKLSYYPILLSLIVAFHFLMVGSRTNALLIFLPAIIMVGELFKKQSLKMLLVFFSSGVFFMWVLQYFRSGVDINTESFEYYMLFSDFLIPNTNTYMAAEVVDKDGCSFGLTVLSQFLSIIPFAQSIVYSLLGISIEDASSSHFFTKYIGSTAGMGTNTIADLYLAFGLCGVVLFMFLLGKISNKWRARIGIDYNSTLMYSALAGLAIYLARASIFYSLRFFFFLIVLRILFIKKYD